MISSQDEKTMQILIQKASQESLVFKGKAIPTRLKGIPVFSTYCFMAQVSRMFDIPSDDLPIGPIREKLLAYQGITLIAGDLWAVQERSE